jgi:hypothetical protein
MPGVAIWRKSANVKANFLPLPHGMLLGRNYRVSPSSGSSGTDRQPLRDAKNPENGRSGATAARVIGATRRSRGGPIRDTRWPMH